MSLLYIYISAEISKGISEEPVFSINHVEPAVNSRQRTEKDVMSGCEYMVGS